MREQIAQALGLSLSRISIKAKTAEGLDSVRPGPGIQAQAGAAGEMHEGRQAGIIMSGPTPPAGHRGRQPVYAAAGSRSGRRRAATPTACAWKEPYRDGGPGSGAPYSARRAGRAGCSLPSAAWGDAALRLAIIEDAEHSYATLGLAWPLISAPPPWPGLVDLDTTRIPLLTAGRNSQLDLAAEPEQRRQFCCQHEDGAARWALLKADIAALTEKLLAKVGISGEQVNAVTMAGSVVQPAARRTAAARASGVISIYTAADLSLGHFTADGLSAARKTAISAPMRGFRTGRGLLAKSGANHHPAGGYRRARRDHRRQARAFANRHVSSRRLRAWASAAACRLY